MQLNFYKNHHSRIFENQEISRAIGDSVELLRKANRLFFVGNGGSMAVCSHMMEDFGKICRKRTYSFSDPALITCYANDYGYENALKEWLKLYFEQGDLLIAISSSGIR